MIYRIKCLDVHIVTPDCVCIPEWGYNVGYRTNTSLTVTFTDNELFVSPSRELTHYTIPINRKGRKSIFELRIWPEYKIVVWWSNFNVDLYQTLITIKDKLKNSEFEFFQRHRCYNDISHNIDITDYLFLFCEIIGGTKYIVKCDLEGLERISKEKTTEFDSQLLRKYHICYPLRKQELIKNNPSLQEWRHLYYKEDCKVWTKKIGSMDVAQWRLLGG